MDRVHSWSSRKPECGGRMRTRADGHDAAWLGPLDPHAVADPAPPARRLGPSLYGDLQAGLTVACVSVPLSISLAISAGAHPIYGVTTAAWAGMAGASTGGCAFNIQGPTGSLSPILSFYSVSFGPQILPWIAVGSGLLTIAASQLGIASMADKMLTPRVTAGFTLGMAATIAANQLPYGLGLRNLHKHRHFSKNVLEFGWHIGSLEPHTTMITFSSLMILVALNRWRPTHPWFVFMAILGMIVGASVPEGEGRFRTSVHDLFLTTPNPSAHTPTPPPPTSVNQTCTDAIRVYALSHYTLICGMLTKLRPRSQPAPLKPTPCYSPS